LNSNDGTTNSEEDGDSGDYIDILDVLDGRTDHDIDMDPTSHSHTENFGTGPSANTGVVEEADSEEDEEEEEDSVLSADEDVNPSALEGLERLVSSLGTSRKRKGDGDLTNDPLPRKRRLVEEKTAVGVEGEFTAVTSGTPRTYIPGHHSQKFLGQQLRLDDLIAPLSSQSSAVLSLKKSVKILDASRTRGIPLSAPLPQRTQDRLDREAAYEQTKTEVDKWKETMQQIKEVVLIVLHLALTDILTQRLNISPSHYKKNQSERYRI
jgi:U3 small nucleolar RNA-associated protein 14